MRFGENPEAVRKKDNTKIEVGLSIGTDPNPITLVLALIPEGFNSTIYSVVKAKRSGRISLHEGPGFLDSRGDYPPEFEFYSTSPVPSHSGQKIPRAALFWESLDNSVMLSVIIGFRNIPISYGNVLSPFLSFLYYASNDVNDLLGAMCWSKSMLCKVQWC